MLPLAVAVSAVIVEVPPRVRVAVAPWVRPPLPASAVATVKLPLLVQVPLTVKLEIESVPARFLPVPVMV